MKSCSLRVKAVIVLVFIFSLSTTVFAESKITVKGQSVYRNSELKLYLNENLYYGGKNKLEFTLKGLEPRGVYTVWLEKPYSSLGLGDRPYSFISDSSGRAKYVAKFEAHKLRSWELIKIVRHKDSMAENMDGDNLVTVFTVDIEEFLSGRGHSGKGGVLTKPKITIYKGPMKP